jgi:hypothetical protein
MESTTFGGGSIEQKTFFNHVFSTTSEGKAELLNVIQYALIAIIPVVVLNKTIQRFFPEADPEKSSLEITIEILLQLIVIFVGIIIIHRIITYIPTYSGFKYDSLALSNVVLAFLIIVLSIQTKVGIKTNILVDRLSELWNGPPPSPKAEQKQHRDAYTSHALPIMTAGKDNNVPPDVRQQQQQQQPDIGPQPANSVLGGSFGSFF